MEATESRRKKLARWCKRVFTWVPVACFVYVLILVVGLIPVNNDFVSSEDGIKLYVVSNAVHADIIVPTTTSVVDWYATFGNAKFTKDVSDQSHVAFGWGDRGFFLETETWDDLKLSTAANALH